MSKKENKQTEQNKTKKNNKATTKKPHHPKPNHKLDLCATTGKLETSPVSFCMKWYVIDLWANTCTHLPSNL